MKLPKRYKTPAAAELAVRRKARELLSDALPRWRALRVRAQWNPDHPDVADDWTFRVEREATGEVMLDIAFRDVAADTRPAIVGLLKLLDEHALLLDVAVEVARVEMGVDAKRKRPRQADPRRERELGALLAEAQEMKTKNPRLSYSEIARRIAERRKSVEADPKAFKHGGAANIYKKLRPLAAKRRKLGNM